MAIAMLRHSQRDALLVALSVLHGALLLVAPSAPLIAVLLWWTANTVAHNFIHLPFFSSRAINALYSCYLSVLLALPQSLWRDRHLAHHAGRKWRMRWSGQMLAEFVVSGAVWLAVALHGSALLLEVWIPGWLGGLLLCQIQGHFEHARGTVSHYGKLYNLAFFNDGYHVEHHARPGVHWSRLPGKAGVDAERSAWPAVLRWLEIFRLESLERLALASPALRAFLLATHERAFRRVLPSLDKSPRITIVGGALFPRTALVLRKLVPDARITIVDRSADNVACARALVGSDVVFDQRAYSPDACAGADVVVFPLAFDGDRERVYAEPCAPVVIVHDWIWKAHGSGCVVSPLLLKRLNVVLR